jgi:hypothetical protein
MIFVRSRKFDTPPSHNGEYSKPGFFTYIRERFS